MAFNSFSYIAFLPIMVLGYFLLPKKVKNIWLLLGSYFFYMNWSAKYAVLMLLSTAITYVSGIWIGKANTLENEAKKIRYRKLSVAFSFCINLAILFFFKYFDFANEYITILFNYLNIPYNIENFNFMLPVGISFYTFQALSYTMDVYRERIEPQKNFITYALFVSFFPQLVAGPIEKSRNLLPQLKKFHNFNWEKFKYGLMLILWGFIKKVIIADRLAILVDKVYNNVSDYHGFSLVVATVCFAFQIYCDFSAYSDIARGSAKLMGIELMRNFDRPYFSKKVSEFWRRWHVSLNEWFRENLYFPLGGNRKGKFRQQINIMIVFLASGLWHGAGFTFVLWGALNGIYIVCGNLTSNTTGKLNKYIVSDTSKGFKKVLQILFTFALIDFTWIFFRANSIGDALYVVQNMFPLNLGKFFTDGYLALGLTQANLDLALYSIVILLVVEILRSNRNLINALFKSSMVLRWLVYIVLIGVLAVYGVYGSAYDATQFIYFQF